MCRGFQENERKRLRIKAFYTTLSPSCSKYKALLPDSLTLHYLPRINGSPLEVNGSSIRPDTPAFVTLHRVVASKDDTRGSVAYASRERVVVCEGVRFEVYVGDVKALRGIFRMDVEEGLKWKVDVRDGGGDEVVEGVREAEVHVVVEGVGTGIRKKVEIVRRQRRRRGRRSGGELEEIPEEREEGVVELGVCGCCECRGEEEEEGVDGGHCGGEMVEVDGVGWAVDVGIWVVCLGVGYLVSRASTSRSLTRKKRFI